MVNSCYSKCAHRQNLLCLQIHADEAINLAYVSKPLISAIRAIPEVARLIPTLLPVFVCVTMSKDIGIHDMAFYPVLKMSEADELTN